MPIDWQKLPSRSRELPFNGDEVLLAIPSLIGTHYGGDGRMVDPDFPFSFYLARWDESQLLWATSETDEETGHLLLLDPKTPIYWAELTKPY